MFFLIAFSYSPFIVPKGAYLADIYVSYIPLEQIVSPPNKTILRLWDGSLSDKKKRG